MKSKPLLFLGFDALDIPVTRSAASAGRMPTFKRLLDTWSQVPTEAPPAVYVGAIWPSFFTCLNPGRHGRYCYEQLVPGTYDTRRILSHEYLDEPSFWHILGEHGRRTAILDVPLQGRPRPINGIQVFQWGAHDPEMPFHTDPPDLREDILSHEGEYPIERRANAHRTTPEEFIGFRDRHLAGVRAKTALTARIMEREPWDLCLSIYGEPHTAGHLLWHLHDPTHPSFSPQIFERTGDAMMQVYEELDRGLAELLERARGRYRTVVFASHGMEAFYHLTFMLDEMLWAIEEANRLTWRRRGLTAAAALIKAGRPLTQPRLQPWLKGQVRILAERYRTIPPRAQRAYFAIPNNKVCGGIRLNLAGREPQGIVRPAERDRVEAALMADLHALRDPETRQPVVKRVYRARDVFNGERMQHLPDLFVEWTNHRFMAQVWSPKAGMIQGHWHFPRTGNHHPHGMLFVEPGAARTEHPSASVMDIGPTLCAAMGVELPGVDGRVIAGLL